MPRKPFESTPHKGEGKMSDETRREVFGGTGRDQGAGRREPDQSPQREGSGASESGSNKQLNHPQNT